MCLRTQGYTHCSQECCQGYTLFPRILQFLFSQEMVAERLLNSSLTGSQFLPLMMICQLLKISMPKTFLNLFPLLLLVQELGHFLNVIIFYNGETHHRLAHTSVATRLVNIPFDKNVLIYVSSLFCSRSDTITVKMENINYFSPWTPYLELLTLHPELLTLICWTPYFAPWTPYLEHLTLHPELPILST